MAAGTLLQMGSVWFCIGFCSEGIACVFPLCVCFNFKSTCPLKLCAICSQQLSFLMQEQLHNFARLTGATISKTWSPSMTHVVASTDADGACRRTLKFLMSILEGKWVLKIDCKFI